MIDSFGLSVGLWVEGCGHVWDDVEQSVQILHELEDELQSLVRDYYLRHAMLSVNMVSKDLGPSFSIQFNVTWDRDDGF